MTITLVAKMIERAPNHALYRHAATEENGRMLFQPCAPDLGAEFAFDEPDFARFLLNARVRSYCDVQGGTGESICLRNTEVEIGDYPALLAFFMRGSFQLYVWLPIIGDRPIVPDSGRRCWQSADLRASES